MVAVDGDQAIGGVCGCCVGQQNGLVSVIFATRAAMAALPDDLRQTAVLVLEPLTHAEVAEIFGISEGTVAWRMSEVKKRLRAMKEAEL